MIVPSHRMPLMSLHEIADGPTYYPLLLNRGGYDHFMLKRQDRRYCIAVLKNGRMVATESGSASRAASILAGYFANPKEIAYLIHVRPK